MSQSSSDPVAMPLAGKTIVITGAASGIGRAWVHGFVQDGATVLAADINAAGLAELTPLGVLPFALDVADADQVRSMIDHAVRQTGRLDALFNNAGLAYNQTVEGAPDGAFERHIAVHLFACINGMRAAIPIMRAQGSGRIINTISRNAETDVARTSAYAAAKAAMWAASRVTAREASDADILVNMLIPGPTRTAIWGRDRPEMQPPEVTYPTARLLATLPAGGPSGKVFWNEREYPMFQAANAIAQRGQRPAG